MQNHLSKPEDLRLQNVTLLRKSAPGPPNSSDEDVSCTVPATESASLQILFKCPTPAIILEMLENPHVLLTCDKVDNPLRLPHETTSERPKVVRTPGVLNIFTSKCASRHNGVHSFDISTSKSGPELVCFVHFDLEMCFAPQRRALFRHLNFQKWSGAGVFCTTMVCFVHFDFEMCFAPQGRAIFTSHVASWLRTRRFSEPTFRPSGATNLGKTQCFATFLPFRAPASSFSSLIFSLLLHLCLASVHIVGSLTSKLPSTM